MIFLNFIKNLSWKLKLCLINNKMSHTMLKQHVRQEYLKISAQEKIK